MRDLHTLLSNANENGPYVIVGHSLGGLYSILYAHTYPKSVVGMVLVDSSHPDQVANKAQILGVEATKTEHDSLMQNEEGADVDAIYAEVNRTHWQTDIPLYVLCRGRTTTSKAGQSQAVTGPTQPGALFRRTGFHSTFNRQQIPRGGKKRASHSLGSAGSGRSSNSRCRGLG